MRLFEHERRHTYLVTVTLFAKIESLTASLPPSRTDLGERLLQAAAGLLVAVAEGGHPDAATGPERFAVARRRATACAALLDAIACLEEIPVAMAGDARETLLDIVRALGGAPEELAA